MFVDGGHVEGMTLRYVRLFILSYRTNDVMFKLTKLSLTPCKKLVKNASHNIIGRN